MTQADRQAISVIIPSRRNDDALKRLENQLLSLDVNEIIIVKPFREDRDTNRHPKTSYLQSKQGRGPQIAKGLAAAKHPYLWILHADSHVSASAPDAIRQVLSNRKVALGCFSLKFDNPSRILSLYAWLSRLDTMFTTFGDQGFFFRRETVLNSGLDLSKYPLMEDFVLRRHLKTYGKTVKSSEVIITSAKRFERHGIIRTQLMNAYFIFAFLLGMSPRKLYDRYYNHSEET